MVNKVSGCIQQTPEFRVRVYRTRFQRVLRVLRLISVIVPRRKSILTFHRLSRVMYYLRAEMILKPEFSHAVLRSDLKIVWLERIAWISNAVERSRIAAGKKDKIGNRDPVISTGSTVISDVLVEWAIKNIMIRRFIFLEADATRRKSRIEFVKV